MQVPVRRCNRGIKDIYGPLHCQENGNLNLEDHRMESTKTGIVNKSSKDKCQSSRQWRARFGNNYFSKIAKNFSSNWASHINDGDLKSTKRVTIQIAFPKYKFIAGAA